MEYPEGATPLDPDELDGLRFKHVTIRGELDQLEQANIQSGYRWLSKYKGKDILNDHFARKLHIKMFGEVWNWAGKYRLTEKNIGIDPVQISVKLRELMDDCQFWVEHDTYVPKEAALIFHHRLVYIHPFPNGNGRFARFYTDALLKNIYRLGKIDWSGGFDLQKMNERRNQYIHALRAADAGSYECLFEFAGLK